MGRYALPWIKTERLGFRPTSCAGHPWPARNRARTVRKKPRAGNGGLLLRGSSFLLEENCAIGIYTKFVG